MAEIGRRKAIFLDRDGVVNKLVYLEDGRIDTPFLPKQFELLPNVGLAIKNMRKLGYSIIIASNQPNVGRRLITLRTFELIRKKMFAALARYGTTIDADYYCFHSSDAAIPAYKKICDCRKPKPGLLKRAAQDLNIDLRQSYMVGDGFADIEAGKKAGCKTILLSHYSSLLSKLIERKKVYPDWIEENILDVVKIISKDTTGDRKVMVYRNIC